MDKRGKRKSSRERKALVNDQGFLRYWSWFFERLREAVQNLDESLTCHLSDTVTGTCPASPAVPAPS